MGSVAPNASVLGVLTVWISERVSVHGAELRLPVAHNGLSDRGGRNPFGRMLATGRSFPGWVLPDGREQAPSPQPLRRLGPRRYRRPRRYLVASQPETSESCWKQELFTRGEGQWWGGDTPLVWRRRCPRVVSRAVSGSIPGRRRRVCPSASPAEWVGSAGRHVLGAGPGSVFHFIWQSLPSSRKCPTKMTITIFWI